MSTIPAFCGRFGHKGYRFNPTGPTTHYGETVRQNPLDWRSRKTLAARLFVGFKVGPKLKWKMNDLVKLVRHVREEQVQNQNSSYVAQRGIYTHRSGVIVDKPGAQVIIIDEQGTKMATFVAQMLALGEVVAKDLKQEQVIVEIQENGIVKQVMSVVA